MRLYLDSCLFNRPYDDQSQILIRLDTEAKLQIQQLIRSGLHPLIWSYILDYENARNPYEERSTQIGTWKRYAEIDIAESPELLQRAKEFNQLGLKKMDALHLACAVAAEADAFLTTDKGILKKAPAVKSVRIQDPIDFLREQSL
ncbi:MAG: PIN domain protein [Lamprobacter sp.]|uniref:PIN domain protein n=1 Tax=Lamprobacter sp. TaxID=3100796 RepID=UPI002B258E7F|nr:PIN domain protein [Lamprobacter sp.]MEA3644313.1 PIN domain protein [Lamprobacter sp.]